MQDTLAKHQIDTPFITPFWFDITKLQSLLKEAPSSVRATAGIFLSTASHLLLISHGNTPTSPVQYQCINIKQIQKLKRGTIQLCNSSVFDTKVGEWNKSIHIVANRYWQLKSSGNEPPIESLIFFKKFPRTSKFIWIHVTFLNSTN